MFRIAVLFYLLIGMGLCVLLGLDTARYMAMPSPLIPMVLHVLAMPGALLTAFVFDDQPWMRILIYAGSVLVNFGLLSWLADNLSPGVRTR